MSDWVVRRAELADRERALELHARAFPEFWSSDLAGSVWDWLFVEAARQGPLPYLVADTGERLAGQYALLPVRLLHDGRVIRALLSLHTATDPDFGRRGIMTTLARQVYADGDAPVVFGFPNRISGPALYRKLDWVELVPFPALVAPLPAARAATPAPLQPLAAAWSGVLARRASRVLSSSGGASVEPLEEFGRWADELWQELAAVAGTCVVRDASYLTWRFCRSPFEYRLRALTRGGAIEGFVATTTAVTRWGRLAYLMELIVRPADRAGARLLLADALRDAIDGGATAMLAIATRRHPQRRELLRAGLAPLPRRISARTSLSFGVRINGPGVDPESLLDIDRWYLSGADFDHV